MLVLLTVTSVTLITLDQGEGGGGGPSGVVRGTLRTLVDPVRGLVGAIASPFGGLADRFGGPDDLRKENARLERELAKARGRVAASKGLERENETLRDLLALPTPDDIASTGARVISFGPSSFEETILIDKGSSEGVEVGNPVVSAEGLVGRVVRVSKHRASVLLVTDARSAVGVRFTSVGEAGIAEGRGTSGVLDLSLIDSSVEIREGDVVVTSGLERGRFPAGIPVARVTKVKAIPGKLEQEITIRPLVDTRGLEILRVLDWVEESLPEATATTTPTASR